MRHRLGQDGVEISAALGQCCANCGAVDAFLALGLDVQERLSRTACGPCAAHATDRLAHGYASDPLIVPSPQAVVWTLA